MHILYVLFSFENDLEEEETSWLFIANCYHKIDFQETTH